MTTSGSSFAAVRDTPSRPDVDIVASANDTIRRTVRALTSYHDMGVDAIAKALGISRATAYRKYSGASEYGAGELAVLALLFGCTVGDFYAGIANRPDSTGRSNGVSIFDDPDLADHVRRRAGVDTRGDTERYRPGYRRSRGHLALVGDLPHDTGTYPTDMDHPVPDARRPTAGASPIRPGA